MQTSEVDLLDIDPFGLVADELPVRTVEGQQAPTTASAEAVAARSLLPAFDRGGEPSSDEIVSWARAAGADTDPGDGNLKQYWTKGPGLAKWIDKPHRWTALYRQLKKHMPNEMAKRVAAQWFFDTLGYWPGHQAGSNPIGPG